MGEKLRESNAPPWETSEESGIAALHRFLADAGLPSDEVHFDEGSGLIAQQSHDSECHRGFAPIHEHPVLKRRISSTPCLSPAWTAHFAAA